MTSKILHAVFADYLQKKKTKKKSKNLMKQEIRNIIIKTNYNPGQNIRHKVKNPVTLEKTSKICYLTLRAL